MGTGKVVGLINALGGGSGGGSNKFIVTLTPTSPDYSGTMDKTVAEIKAAYEAGQEIWFKTILGETSYVETNLNFVLEDELDYPSFGTQVIEMNAGVLIVASTVTTDDGTNQTYVTTIYSLTPAS